MSIAQIIDVESIRFSATDLDLMRAFLTDFGMIEAEATGDGVLRFRGTGDAPFIHETSLGEPGLVAYTLRAASIADLDALAEADSVPITDAPGPGGGKMVTLTDPDGFTVEVLADKARVAPLSRGPGGRWNFIDDRERHNVTRRVAPGPAHVARLGMSCWASPTSAGPGRGIKAASACCCPMTCVRPTAMSLPCSSGVTAAIGSSITIC